MRLRKFLPLVVAASVVLGPAASRATEPAAQQHFFWKATGGEGVAYLLGTIHVGDKDLYPLAPVIEDSFKRSDALVEEVDLTSAAELQQASQELVKQGIYQDGDVVTNHLSQATRTELAQYAKGGQLIPGYTHAKPWLLALMIMQQQLQQMGLDKATGLDLHFAEEAARLHKPVEGLETADFQIRMFSGFPDDLQDQLLLTTLVDARRAEEMLQKTLAAWRNGDAQAMEQVMTSEVSQYPFLAPLMDKLFYQRNDAMTQKIDKLLHAPKVYFVAVGAGHLIGERGIVSQLRSRNYTVERQ